MERTTRSENGGNHHHLLWDLSFASACCLVVLENNLFPGFEVCICFREGNNLALWILNGFPLPFPGTLKNCFFGGLLAFFLAIFLILSHFGGILPFFLAIFVAVSCKNKQQNCSTTIPIWNQDLFKKVAFDRDKRSLWTRREVPSRSRRSVLVRNSGNAQHAGNQTHIHMVCTGCKK